MDTNLMEQNRKMAITLSVILGILLLSSAITNVYVFFVMAVPMASKVAAALHIIAIIFALYYLIRGFKKAAANAFKIFLAFSTGALLAEIVNTNMMQVNNTMAGATLISGYFSIVFTIGFACMFTMCVAKDLGRTTSLLLSWGAVFTQAILFFTAFFFAPGVFRGGDAFNTVLIIRSGSLLLNSIILLTMMYAKYADKVARGREV